MSRLPIMSKSGLANIVGSFFLSSGIISNDDLRAYSALAIFTRDPLGSRTVWVVELVRVVSEKTSPKFRIALVVKPTVKFFLVILLVEVGNF